MDFKGVLRLVTNPFVLGAAGAYLGHRQYGSKYGHLAIAGGAAAGMATGYVAQKIFLPPAPAPVVPGAPVLPGTAQPPLQGGQGEYVEWGSSATAPQGASQPQAPTTSHDVHEATAQRIAYEDNGSLGGSETSLGSYGSGLNESGIEEALAEVRDKGLN